MKKIWIILVVIVVLVAAWLGAAWYTGTRIEAQAGQIVARANAALTKSQAALGAAQVKPLSYERGLLSSHARYALVVNGGPLMEYDVTFAHGPFPLAALQHGSLAPQQYQAHVEALASAGPLKMMAGALLNGKPLLATDIGCSYGHHCAGAGSVPPIDVDLGRNGKLAFGGVQVRFDADQRAETDYQIDADAQLLPLTIGGQPFGSGQITIKQNAQSWTEEFDWKTDQGAGKLSLALAKTRPTSLWDNTSLNNPHELAGLVKSASAKLQVSRPMAIDLAARAINLLQGVAPDTAKQQISAQLDAALAGPQVNQFVRTQGDLLVSDWEYAGGKLSINGQDRPEVLQQFKEGYLAQLHAVHAAGK